MNHWISARIIRVTILVLVGMSAFLWFTYLNPYAQEQRQRASERKRAERIIEKISPLRNVNLSASDDGTILISYSPSALIEDYDAFDTAMTKVSILDPKPIFMHELTTRPKRIPKTLSNNASEAIAPPSGAQPQR